MERDKSLEKMMPFRWDPTNQVWSVSWIILSWWSWRGMNSTGITSRVMNVGEKSSKWPKLKKNSTFRAANTTWIKVRKSKRQPEYFWNRRIRFKKPKTTVRENKNQYWDKTGTWKNWMEVLIMPENLHLKFLIKSNKILQSN